MTANDRIPRDPDDDYTREAASARVEFAREKTGAKLEHLSSYSIDPAGLPGNVEGFIGTAQVPVGLAGPLLVDGEHARGEYWVPLATTEGTLVASYNRGMKLTRDAGGVRTTVIDDAMQRAPVFIFASAREARDFGTWLEQNFERIKQEADSTSSVASLRDIQQFPASKMVFTRFNYTTGDAAGQNMTSKATAFACKWIASQRPEIEHFMLESNFATDKKSSQVNMMHTRGKRVVAEVTLPADRVRERMKLTPERMFHRRHVANLAGFMAGVHNNGAHAANAIAAIFIATGQDAANVAESQACYGYSELLPNGDYYASITLPSLIVATYGGGTGLPTQRECLELMDCWGTDRVNRLAEIVAATVLCGDLSLGWAVLVDEWVTAHERLGRNRPDEG